MNNKYDRDEAPKTYDEMVAAGYEMTGEGVWMPREEAGSFEVLITEAEPAVKLVMFINGEEVIAEVQESFAGDTYTLINPLRVMVQSTSADGDERTSTVAFTDWMPLSDDRSITVNRSFVATITNPIESLIASYRNG